MRALACVLVVLCWALPGCSFATGQVRKQAARDLQCPQDDVAVHAGEYGRFTARGCHGFVEYSCGPNSQGRTRCVRAQWADLLPPGERAPRVRHKAASLLACDPAALQLQTRPGDRFRVEGCGRAVDYECASRDDCCAFTRPGVQSIAEANAAQPVETVPSGSLAKSAIKAVIAGARAEVRACYEAELKGEPSIAGVVDSKFVIGPDGRVEASAILRSSLEHPGVEACIADAISKLEFPPPAGGGIVVVVFPYVLTAGGPLVTCR